MKLKYEPLQCIECGGFLRDFLPACRCGASTTFSATFCDCGQCESSRRGMKETGRKYQVPLGVADKKYCAEHEFTFYDSECYFCKQDRRGSRDERQPPVPWIE